MIFYKLLNAPRPSLVRTFVVPVEEAVLAAPGDGVTFVVVGGQDLVVVGSGKATSRTYNTQDTTTKNDRISQTKLTISNSGIEYINFVKYCIICGYMRKIF